MNFCKHFGSLAAGLVFLAAAASLAGPAAEAAQAEEATEQHVFTLRADMSLVRAPRWRLALRGNVPLLVDDVPTRDNPSPLQFRLKDIQSLRIHAFDPRPAMPVGIRLILATAGRNQGGTRSVEVMGVVTYRLRRPDASAGDVLTKLIRHAVGVEGDGSNRAINGLKILPGMHFKLPDQWSLTLWPGETVRYDFNLRRWFVPFDVKVGKTFTPRLVSSVQVSTPFLDETQLSDISVEARLRFSF